MLNTSFCCSSLTTHCVHMPLCSLHILMATDCHIPNSGRLLLVLFYSSLWFPFVSFKAGRRMPSIFMRFWYTSFHLLQYLLYQEIGGERMADQPDIASPAFQRRPPTPPFFFLISLHSSFLYLPPMESFKSEQPQTLCFDSFLENEKEGFFCTFLC